jgi:O-antigen ligase
MSELLRPPALHRFLDLSAVAAIAVALGALVSIDRKLAASLALAAWALALLVRSSRTPALTVLLVAAVGLSATVDLLGQIRIGSTTLYAWATGSLTVLLLAATLARHQHRIAHTLPKGTYLVLLFQAWAVISFTWYSPTLAGLQNVIVFMAFVSCFLLSAQAARSGLIGFGVIRSLFFWAYLIAAALYASSVLLSGLGGGAVVGSRSYALFALTGLAWSTALVRHGFRREGLIAVVSFLLILFSLSRLAFAVALILVALGTLDFRSPGLVNRSLGVVAVMILFGYSAVVWFSPLNERMSGGDSVATPLRLSIDASGRTGFWSTTWDSAVTSPIRGQGAGSAELAIARHFSASNHPHNDYLRLFHDFGLIGVTLFFLGVGMIVRTSWNCLRVENRAGQRAIHLASLLAMIAILLSMLTDNSIVYLFVVVPIALMCGYSIGGGASSLDEHMQRGVAAGDRSVQG